MGHGRNWVPEFGSPNLGPERIWDLNVGTIWVPDFKIFVPKGATGVELCPFPFENFDFRPESDLRTPNARVCCQVPQSMFLTKNMDLDQKLT